MNILLTVGFDLVQFQKLCCGGRTTQGWCVVYHLTPSKSAMVEILWSSPRRSLPNGTIQTSDCSLVIDRAKSDYSIVVQFRNLGTMCPLGHSKRFLVTLTL